MSNVLHITNDYSGSAVYKNLIRELDELGVQQTIYTPVKTSSRIGKNEITLKVKGSDIIYSHILNKNIDRLFYKLKVKKILKDIECKIDVSNIDFIHAHTWYSDGGVAYLLHKKYNIPYMIAVRSTDLNVFYKYLYYERSFGKKIIQFSQHVVMISASFKKSFERFSSLVPILQKNKNKTTVIPNGVDPYWLSNYREKQRISKTKKNINILYIGTFIKRKYLPELQEAIIELNRSTDYDIQLHIVGGGGKAAKDVEKKTESFPSIFIYHGKVYDKDQLIRIIRKCDLFAMPSRSETFGLVYVEAMLQGLPILYTKNEGIDGFYTENIGEKVSKVITVEKIKKMLLKMIRNYNDYNIPTAKITENHDWSLIAKKYKQLYQN